MLLHLSVILFTGGDLCCPPLYSGKASGTHPTGMLSCLSMENYTEKAMRTKTNYVCHIPEKPISISGRVGTSTTCLLYASFISGRDGARATCLLYASFGDTFRQSTMVFTEQTGLAKLYSMVTYAFDLSK